MRPFRGVIIPILAFTWLFPHPPNAAWGQCMYEVEVELAFPAGCGLGTITIPEGISDSGEWVCGRYECVGGNTISGWVWSEATGFIDLVPPFSHSEVWPNDVNDLGVVVGKVITPEGEHGFVHDLQSNEWWTLVPPFPGNSLARATAINNVNVVAGWRSTTDQGWPWGAFTWTEAAGYVDLPSVASPSRADTYAQDISDAGVVVGSAGHVTFNGVAMMWDTNTNAYVEFPLPPDAVTSGQNAIAEDSSQLSGGSALIEQDDPPDSFHQATWYADDETALLPGLSPGDPSGVWAVLSSPRQLVGSSCDDPICHGAMWAQGQVYRLGDLTVSKLDGVVTFANGVTRDGRILVRGGSGSATSDLVAIILRPTGFSEGDANGDCVANVDDLLMLLGDWGQPDSPADVDGSGLVDVQDLLQMLGNWGQTNT